MGIDTLSLFFLNTNMTEMSYKNSIMCLKFFLGEKQYDRNVIFVLENRWKKSSIIWQMCHITFLELNFSRMYYLTKWDFLESIGKDRRDVRLVDRMIRRWEVLHNERGYSLTKDAYKEAYDWELERFKKEKAELVKRINELENGSSNDGMMAAYERAIKRLNEKDDLIYSLIMDLYKLENPRGDVDEGDYVSSVYEKKGYDPHDENYL